jgi:hypothetical protein
MWRFCLDSQIAAKQPLAADRLLRQLPLSVSDECVDYTARALLVNVVTGRHLPRWKH